MAHCTLASNSSLLRPLFLSRLPAGFPSPADDYLQENLDLNRYLIRNPLATFFFRVRGESMKNAGIRDDDVLIVDRSITARHGHIVVAVLDGEYTVKRLHHRQGLLQLHPENPAFPILRLHPETSFEVWGVVVGAVTRFAA